MAKSKKELGKGIRALLGDIDVNKEQNTGDLGSSIKAAISEINIDLIEINPFQPRMDFDEQALQELSASIKTLGLIQPITLRKLKNGRYQLISGERRLRASKLAGLKSVPAYTRDVNDQEMLEMALVENIQREELNPLEIAFTYNRLMEECDLNQEQLGDRVGKERSTVANYLRLLKLPPDVQSALKTKKISMGHARALIGLPVDQQLYLYKEIISKKLSVRKVEQLASEMNAKKKASRSNKPSKELPVAYQNLQQKLTSHFGTKVLINRKNAGRGEITIQYYSDDDLNRIIDLLDE